MFGLSTELITKDKLTTYSGSVPIFGQPRCLSCSHEMQFKRLVPMRFNKAKCLLFD